MDADIIHAENGRCGMTIQECKRRERIYKKLVEKFLPTFTFDSKDCTPEELECIKVALLRSVAIEQLNIADLKKRKDGKTDE